MKLGALFNQRRNRRLALAVFAALMVHLGLMLSGELGISMFSAPSTEDRVLTLTLENTNYEGLKEMAELDSETVNNAKLAKPATPKSEPAPQLVELQPRAIEAQKAIEPLALAEQEVESVSQEVSEQNNNFSQNDKPIAQTPQSEALPDQALAGVGEAELEVFTGEGGTILLSAKTASLGVEDKELEPTKATSAEPIRKTLKPKQYAKMEKKLKRVVTKFKDLESVPEVLDWEDGGETYTAQFTPVPAESDMQTDEVAVEVFTEQDGKKLTTSLRFKKLAFSNFAQFVNQWDSNVIIHDDILDGRFHSNTKINLSSDRNGAPVFHGKVTTASFRVNYEGRARKKNIFKGGLETGVKKIRMPRPRQLFSEKNKSQENVVVLNQDARLIFTEDGHYLWQALDEARPMEKHKIGDQPLYLMAAPSVSLTISGVVNGAVAIYSPRRITIENDIVYKNTADLDQGGDFLGLVSGRSVVIAERDKMKEGDLTIHASIYANNQFAVKGVRGKRSGTLNVFGSVSASTITATEPRYATNIVFDSRLENLRPPGFPVTDRYELVAQDEQWTVVQDAYLESIDDQLDQPTFDLGGAIIVDDLF